MGWNNYSYTKKEHQSGPQPGKYRCMVMNCEEKLSKAGNDMLEITLRLSGTRVNVKYWIVQTEGTDEHGIPYWQNKMNNFMDAFPSINGSMVFATWRGAIGAASFKEGNNGYLELNRLIYPEAAERLGDFLWLPRDEDPAEMPQKVELVELAKPDATEEESDFPF